MNNIPLEIKNLIEKAQNFYMPVNSEIFFTPNIYKKLPNKYENIFIYTNGYTRKQIYLIPKDFENEFSYFILKISVKNNFKLLKHKDFLGSILGLGLNRDMIGDLFVKNNECIVLVNETSKKIIEKNLTHISKNTCEIEEVKNFDYEYFKLEYKELKVLTSSLRLDSLVKGILNISRNEAQNLIKQKEVLIDYEIIENNSYEIEGKEILTIRKKGKYLIENWSLTKKQKYLLQVLKYE